MEIFASTGNWIEALGKTLLHSLWIALLVLSLLRLILNSIPDRYSGLRYRISLISMLVLMGSVGTLFFLLFSPENALQPASDPERSSLLMSLFLKDQASVQQTTDVHLYFVICTYIYLAGIPFVLVRSAFSVRYLRVIKESGFPVQEMWHSRFEQLKNSLGIKRKVALMETNQLTAPALIGFLKPVVLVPAGMFSNLSVSQVETILLHELYHLRRLDTLVNVVQLIIENLFFYNPAVWAISKIIRNEREKCCDDRVLDSCANPLSYAKALYQIAGQDHQFTHLAPGAGGSDQFQLFTRINRILNQNAMKNNIREKLFSLLIFAGGVILMLTVTGFSSGFSIIKDNEAWQKASIPQKSDIEPIVKPITDPVMESEPIVAPLEEPAILHRPDTIPEVENEPEEVEKIDWEEIKKEIEEARIEVMEEIDWEEIKKEMEEARIEAMEEIDWEAIKKEMEEARITMDSLKMDMDFDFDFDMDIDIDKIKEEVNRSMEDINWEEIETEMARVKIHLDSVFRDLDLDFDMDVDL